MRRALFKLAVISLMLAVCMGGIVLAQEKPAATPQPAKVVRSGAVTAVSASSISIKASTGEATLAIDEATVVSIFKPLDLKTVKGEKWGWIEGKFNENQTSIEAKFIAVADKAPDVPESKLEKTRVTGNLDFADQISIKADGTKIAVTANDKTLGYSETVSKLDEVKVGSEVRIVSKGEGKGARKIILLPPKEKAAKPAEGAAKEAKPAK